MDTPALTVLAEDRHWWFAGRTRAILRFLDAALADSPPLRQRTILDIGCGAGNMAHHLAHYGRVLGLDYSGRPLGVAKGRGLDICQAVGERLPFADHSFDLITLLDTLEHIPDELGVLQECFRSLKPGGRLLITVPAFMWLWSYNDEINNHQRRYTLPELDQKLELVGFHPRRASYNNFLVFPLIAGVRLLRRAEGPDLASPHLTAADEVYQVEMEPTPEPLNSALHLVGWLESELLRRWPLPIGSSALYLAVKPTG